MKTVPLLLTIDLHERPNVHDEVHACLDALDELNWKATFFIPAKLLEKESIYKLTKEIFNRKHEVGNHSFSHDQTIEDYRCLSTKKQYDFLKLSTSILADCVGKRPVSFRAPAFRLGQKTLEILNDLGYWADVSVTSQRLCLITSDVTNYHMLYSPRQPYHPNAANPYRRGNLHIWEIPLAGVVLPASSSTFIALNSFFAKVHFNLLYYEAAIIGRPLVFQMHAEEFYFNATQEIKKKNWNDLFSYDSKGGFKGRYLLVGDDEHLHFKKAKTFLSFLSRKKMPSMSVRKYCEDHLMRASCQV